MEAKPKLTEVTSQEKKDEYDGGEQADDEKTEPDPESRIGSGFCKSTPTDENIDPVLRQPPTDEQIEPEDFGQSNHYTKMNDTLRDMARRRPQPDNAFDHSNPVTIRDRLPERFSPPKKKSKKKPADDPATNKPTGVPKKSLMGHVDTTLELERVSIKQAVVQQTAQSLNQGHLVPVKNLSSQDIKNLIQQGMLAATKILERDGEYEDQQFQATPQGQNEYAHQHQEGYEFSQDETGIIDQDHKEHSYEDVTGPYDGQDEEQYDGGQDQDQNLQILAQLVSGNQDFQMTQEMADYITASARDIVAQRRMTSQTVQEPQQEQNHYASTDFSAALALRQDQPTAKIASAEKETTQQDEKALFINPQRKRIPRYLDTMDESGRYQCPDAGCNATFASSGGLHVHRKIHDYDGIPCPLCQPDTKARYKVVPQIQRHISNVHPDANRMCSKVRVPVLSLYDCSYTNKKLPGWFHRDSHHDRQVDAVRVKRLEKEAKEAEMEICKKAYQEKMWTKYGIDVTSGPNGQKPANVPSAGGPSGGAGLSGTTRK